MAEPVAEPVAEPRPAVESLPTREALEQRLSSTRNVLPIYKEALADCRSFLEARFHAGEEVAQLITDRAQFVDTILSLAWNRFVWEENLHSFFKSRVSLVAVGGYGRGELHPHSDIDLLILLERNSYRKHSANIQSFLTLLWDIGLEVGHSVRSISESKVQARFDVTVVTAMMEGRTLCGDPELFERVTRLIAPKRMWSLKQFFAAKKEEQLERHRKSNHTEYSLEPNVKTSPGGLRDIQTVMWVAKRNFGDLNFDGLVEKNFLTAGERDILRAGERLLWKIRYGLHLITGREDDRLLFDYQRNLAEMFGYEDGDQLAVEQFMQEYYRTAMMVYATSETLLQLFEEEIINRPRRDTVTPINERFQLRNNYIEVTSEEVFEEHPPALLELFLLIGSDSSIEGTRAGTIKLIRQSLHLIDDDFRSNPEVTETFLDILRSSEKLSSQLIRMNRYGILGAYLPEFGRVIGQMQFDLFHVYTVDAHTLQVVRNMRRFRYKNQEQRFPVAAHIFPRLPKVELLYIAGLYHDIAKGMGGDHSELGINIARLFCQRHHLSAWDTRLVCWLVKHHLVMSSTAQRKDISDPQVVNEFASMVEHQTRLDYLYALTVADINATNPTLWNSWRASLMSKLYVETKKVLRHGLENAVDKNDYVNETRNHAIERLVESGISREEVLEIWADADDEYFMRESIADIITHTHAIKDHDAGQGPLILINDITSRRENEGATHIFICAKRHDYTFASVVSAIDMLGLQIMDARISNRTGRVFDTYVVLEANGTPVGPLENRRKQIRSLISEHLDQSGRAKPRNNQRTPRALKPFAAKTEVITSVDEENQLTVLEVITPDRPGLLVIIANLFAELEIELHSAKITTLGERVEDVFYITDANSQVLTDTGPIVERLCSELDSHVQQASA